MSSSVAVAIATFIIATAGFALLMLTASRRRAAKEEEFERAASTRGWKFESPADRGYRVHRWSGTTDGVSWRAESLHYTSGNRRQRRPNIARWHTDAGPGINAPLLCMAVPKGKEPPSSGTTSSDSFLGRMAQKAVGLAFDKAVDAYFGVELGMQVDAGSMHRVETRLPGFVVMAANKDEGARLLAHGLEQSLTTGTHDPTSIFSNEDRPWILFRPGGVSLARMEHFRDLDEIDGFVRAGIALTRSGKFGRPFL